MNQSSLDALNNASSIALAQEATTSLLSSILCPFSVISNFLVVYVIFRTKKLHNKSQYLILLHSAAGMVWAITFFCISLKNYTASFYGFPLITNQGLCKFIIFPLEFSGSIVRRYALMLGMDRCLLVVRPTFYRIQVTLRYISILHIICWCPLLVRIPLYFVGYDANRLIPFCNSFTVLSDIYRVFQSVESNILTGLTWFMYISLIAVMLYRFKTAKLAGATQRREWKRRWELEALLSITVVGLMYLGSSVISNVGFVAFANSPAYVTRVFKDVSTGIALMSSISHLFVYLAMNGTFRQAFQRLLTRRGQNDVMPM